MTNLFASLLSHSGQSGDGIEDEDCLGIDLDRLVVQDDGDDWLLTDGDSRMMVFADRKVAERAKEIIEHYSVTRRCFVGRPDPSMEYFLVDGRAPEGSMAGEDCVSFDPDALEIRPQGDEWLLTDGSHQIEVFPSEAEAVKARRVVGRYGFDRYCFVGRPDPSMTYWRSSSGDSGGDDSGDGDGGDGSGDSGDGTGGFLAPLLNLIRAIFS